MCTIVLFIINFTTHIYTYISFSVLLSVWCHCKRLLSTKHDFSLFLLSWNMFWSIHAPYMLYSHYCIFSGLPVVKLMVSGFIYSCCLRLWTLNHVCILEIQMVRVRKYQILMLSEKDIMLIKMDMH